jgi:peptide methionine sulfoxide reductase MsrA
LDFKTEYNFIFARLAAQRDLTSQTHTGFSRTIFDAFYEAEKEHQDYYKSNQNNGYCNFVITPKLAKLRKLHTDKLK